MLGTFAQLKSILFRLFRQFGCCRCFIYSLKSGCTRLHLCLISLLCHVIVRDLENRVAVLLHRASSLLVRPLISVLFLSFSFFGNACDCVFASFLFFFLWSRLHHIITLVLLFIVSVSRNAIWCNPHHMLKPIKHRDFSNKLTTL